MNVNLNSENLDFLPLAPYDGYNVHVEMCNLTKWFVEHVAFSYDFAVEHERALASGSLERVLEGLSHFSYGATCAGLSLFMASAAKRHGYDAIAMNFGNASGPESHVLVLVRSGTGERVFYDPTLGCYSGKTDGTPVSIREIIELLRQGRGEELRWIDIGPRDRSLMFCSESPPPLPVTSPVRRLGQGRSLATTDLNFLAFFTWNRIWQWARARNAIVRTMFDCLLFTISTSGEDEAEELAEQLRGITR